jgi:hypothetical protein
MIGRFAVRAVQHDLGDPELVMVAVSAAVFTLGTENFTIYNEILSIS